MHISAHIYAECIQFIDKHTYGIYNIYTFHGVCVPSAVWNEYFAIDMHS